MPDRTTTPARLLAALACLVGLTALAACAGSDPAPAPTGGAAAQSPLTSPPPAMMTPHGY